MKAALKTDLKSISFSSRKSFTRLRDKEINLIDFKFYQKLFIFLVSFSIILIYPESPRELGNTCENHNSRAMCNIW